jgi:DNA-binding NarL/FixJ family response regulator
LPPAWVEIALAIGDLEAARAACGELDDIAARQRSELLAATAAHARGALALAEGNAGDAVAALRSAWRTWQELEAPYEARAPPDAHGLSAREVQVLRLVANGMSNRDIATELVISERTVARHVQNIFAKLRLSSRAAASVFASEHGLL